LSSPGLTRGTHAAAGGPRVKPGDDGVRGVAEALRNGAARLAAAGIDGARREARVLLAHALSVQPAELAPAAVVPTGDFDALVTRRAAHEPLALILGHREFWSLDFAVSPDTLVPRADSETLIEAALAAFPTRGEVRRVLDLGTGTGCLLLAALHEFPVAFGVGVDRGEAVTTLARRNALLLGLAGRAVFVCADWAGSLAGRFDLVLCNPPYVRASEIASLMPEVALHEPASALSGGVDGLDAYRAIIPSLAAVLSEDGVAILELGQGQAADVTRIAAAEGFAVALRADLAGIDRAIVLRPLRQAGP
jgi:release factor glutamine methyltransferase